MTHGTFRAGPFTLSWSMEGDGPAALVIGSAVYYPRLFSRALRRHLRLVFADHRGFGRVDGPPADYGLSTVVADMEALRRHLDLPPVIVIGHSGHGYLALEMARRFPDAVSHVVLVATGAGQDAAHRALADRAFAESVDPARHARFAADMAALPADLAAAPDRAFVTLCLRMGARSWADPGFDATPLWQGVTPVMPVIDHLWGEAFAAYDTGAALAEITAPVLVAMGRFDTLVAPHWAWDAARASARDLTLRVFDRSAHCPPLEEPALFDAVLLNWLGLR